MSFINSISKEEVLKGVKQHGPITPIGIRRKIGEGDSITIGAALSELVRGGQVLYTTVQKGSSPFYYAPTQKEKLEDLISYLNEKDLRACKKLKDEKVLEDDKQRSLIRVSLRNIPDYSKKLVANIKGEKRVFWRYYLVSESDAITIIKDMLRGNQPVRAKEDTKPVQDAKPKKESVEKEEDQEQPARKQEAKPKQSRLREEFDFDDEFWTTIHTYLENQDVDIEEVEQVRKGRDYELTVGVPTNVGKLRFYCRCRKKKKLSKGDVSRAYIQGLKKQMPVLILTTGSLGKKTREEIDKEFKGLLVKEEIR